MIYISDIVEYFIRRNDKDILAQMKFSNVIQGLKRKCLGIIIYKSKTFYFIARPVDGMYA